MVRSSAADMILPSMCATRSGLPARLDLRPARGNTLLVIRVGAAGRAHFKRPVTNVTAFLRKLRFESELRATLLAARSTGLSWRLSGQGFCGPVAIARQSFRCSLVSICVCAEIWCLWRPTCDCGPSASGICGAASLAGDALRGPASGYCLDEAFGGVRLGQVGRIEEPRGCSGCRLASAALGLGSAEAARIAAAFESGNPAVV